MNRRFLEVSILVFVLISPLCSWCRRPLRPHNKVILKYKPDSVREDKNHADECTSDIGFNEFRGSLCLLDQQVVGPYMIGIDMNATEYKRLDPPFMIRGIGPNRDSLLFDSKNLLDHDKPYLINGKRYDSFSSRISTKGPVRLVTLEEVRRKYFPEVKGNCIYMINKFFILNDVELYKLDEDFIYTIEKLTSEDIASVTDIPFLKKNLKKKKSPKFTVIRIFTKTPQNWHPIRIG